MEEEKKAELIKQIQQLRSEQNEIRELISLLSQKKQTLISEKDILKQTLQKKKITIPNDTPSKQLLLLKRNLDEEKELSASLVKEFQDINKMQLNKEHEIEMESRRVTQNLRSRLDSYLSTESELRMKYRQKATELISKLLPLTGNTETCCSIQNYLSQCSKITIEIAKCQRDINGLASRFDKLHAAIKYPDANTVPKCTTFLPLAPNGPKVAVQRRISYTSKAKLKNMNID